MTTFLILLLGQAPVLSTNAPSQPPSGSMSRRIPFSAQAGGRFGARDYPLQEGFRYEKAGDLAALCLVEPLAPGGASVREFVSPILPGEAPREPQERVWTERVRVVASDALAAGTDVRVVVRGAASPAYPMLPGHRYLVLASLPRAGRLEFETPGPVGVPRTATDAAPGEIAGLAVFESRATRIDPSSALPDRIANSVVDCIPGSDDAGLRRATDWLARSGYPGGGRTSDVFGREPFPLAKRIQDMAEGQSAYRRFRLFQVLCNWHVFGSEQPFVDAMIALADKPDALGRADFLTGGELQFSQSRWMTDPKYVAVRLDANRWADIVSNAKNDGIRRYLLVNVHRAPDEAHNLEIARALLASPNEAILDAVAEHFAHVLKRPEWMPEYRPVGGRSVWVNETATLRAIRERYGLPVGTALASPGG